MTSANKMTAKNLQRLANVGADYKILVKISFQIRLQVWMTIVKMMSETPGKHSIYFKQGDKLEPEEIGFNEYKGYVLQSVNIHQH